MKSFTKLFLMPIFLFTANPAPLNDNFCGIRNTAFNAGENVTMTVYYSTLGAYVPAGEANFTTTLERFNGKPVYHCVGVGKTYSFFDNFYKVRDRYESYIDTGSMQPYKFIRNIDEGGYKKYTFQHSGIRSLEFT